LAIKTRKKRPTMKRAASEKGSIQAFRSSRLRIYPGRFRYESTSPLA
jgi:hypothetical protein